GGCVTDGCGQTSATSRPSTMPSPPSTRLSGSRGRRLSAFVREDSGAASGSALLVDYPRPHGRDRPLSFATVSLPDYRDYWNPTAFTAATTGTRVDKSAG